MNKFEIFINSKASWSLIGLFLVTGLTAIQPQLSGNIATGVQILLSLLTLYLHPTELKVAGQTGMLGAKKI